MKRIVTTVLTDLHGEAMNGAGGPLTLRSACVDALLGAYQDEVALPGEEKYRRFQLATKLSSSDEVDLTAEEITQLKKLVGKAWSPLVVGRVYELLELDA